MDQNLRETAVHGSKEYPFALYDIKKYGNNFTVSLHWHEEIEIIYVKEGSLCLTIGNQKYVGRKGEIFIVNTEEIHSMEVKEPVCYGTILFPISSLFFDGSDSVTVDYLFPLSKKNLLFPVYIENQKLQRELFGITQKIMILNQEEGTAYRMGTRIYLLDFIYRLVKADLLLQGKDAMQQSLWDQEILSYIGKHFTENLTLAEVAERFHMSYKYFSRFFKKEFHITFSEYLGHLRMEHAENLLSTTDLPVTEVSLQSGFNNISFFIRSFKKKYGSSPLKYRHRGRTDKQTCKTLDNCQGIC